MASKGKTVATLTALPADLSDALGEHYRIVSVDGTSLSTQADMVEVVVTTAMRGFDQEDLAKFPALKLVLSQGVGIDRLDLDAASERGVSISVTPDILTEDVADFAIGMTYAIARRITEADRFVRAGRWGDERIAPSTSLHGKRLGIVGMGKIGRAIARRAGGIGMTVGYTGRSAKDGIAETFLPSPAELAAWCDVLVLACAGGTQTRHLCNAAVLENLGPEGFLVNISRGSVVDEDALIEALQTCGIAGAALDVFSREPQLAPRFLKLENVVVTPHSASVTKEVRARLIACMLDEADAYFSGRTLKHVANAPVEPARNQAAGNSFAARQTS